MSLLRRLIVLACCLVACEAQAQFATVRGRVTDAADEQPMQGVNVVVQGEDGDRRGTATDGEGYFLLNRLAPGAYVLTTSFVGYFPHADTLTLGFGEQPTLNVRLVANEEVLGEVVVEEERARQGRSGAGLATVRPSALARVPIPDVTADLASYLLARPGVVAAGDRGGQLFIRGGTATQNLVLIDGMPLYQPFHIVGFYSAFPADLISYADVYAGGFGARYGGRISSVIDVATRNGNKRRVVGAVSLAPFLSAARLEVPLLAEKISLVASVRESVIEHVAPDLLGTPLPYRFGDRFAKFHAFLNQTSSFSLTALQTHDQGDVANTAGVGSRIEWRNAAYGGRFLYLPQDFPVLAEVALYTSFYESTYGPKENPDRSAEVGGFNAEFNFSYLLGRQELRFGIFGRSNKYQYNLGQGQRDDFREFVSEGGLFIEGKAEVWPGLTLAPGVRFHSFPSRSQATWEPRFRATYQPGGPGGPQQLSFAGGVYHQEIVGLSNARDVTDTFEAWAPTPPNQRLPRAVHAIAGWQRRLTPWLDVSAEAYYKALDHIAVPDFGAELARIVDFVEADGEARGLDLTVEWSRSFLYGYLGYGLAWVRYDPKRPLSASVDPFAETAFHPAHDRRHQLQAIVQLARGPYSLNLRWQYGSGLPFTQVNGFFETLPVVGSTDSFHTDQGATSVSFDAPYRGRLPAYHRLDVSLERRFRLPYLTATLQAAAINAYDRANIFDYDVFTNNRIDQLPIIPSLGLKVEVQ